MVEWLLAPIDISRAHDVPLFVAWHARFMTLAWIVLFPLGIGAARFFKITPKQDWPERIDHKGWWYAHLTLQYGGGLAVLVALSLIWSAHGRSGTAGVHAWFGWIAVALCTMQFIGGWLRGSKGGPAEHAAGMPLDGDHYGMTKRRRIFEHGHKRLGYVAMIVALVAVFNGLWAANAPRWIWLVIGAWLFVLLALALRLQRRGFAVDTYQAIWGPSPLHPGNRMKPIGWGIRRRDVRLQDPERE